MTFTTFTSSLKKCQCEREVAPEKSVQTRKQQNVLLTSNCHAYFAAVFDVYGRVEVALDAKGKFKYRLVAAATEPYPSQFRALYGGRVTKDGCNVEGDEAKAFAKAVKYFTIRQRKEFHCLLSLSQANGAQQPLTDEQRRKRVKAVESLKRAVTRRFELPKNFVKPRPWNWKA